MPTGDPSLLSATELSAALTSRKLSPVEITEAFLARIAAQDHQLHAALIAVYADDVRAKPPRRPTRRSARATRSARCTACRLH